MPTYVLLCILTLCGSCSLVLEAVETNVNYDSAYLATIRSRQDNQWTGNIGVILGINKMFHDEWDAIEFQPNFGIVSDFGKKDWLFNIAVDYKSSSASDDDPGLDVEGSVSELDIGLRMHIGDDIVHWKAYIGAGIAFIEDELDNGALSLSGSETGYWINAGLYYRWQQRWNIGLDLRYSTLVKDFEDNEQLTPSHITYGLLVGYHF